MIKKWIEENILDKNGNPQGRSFKCKNKKGCENCLLIINLTSFLDKSVSVSERIYCIMNNISEPLTCKQCNNNVKFINYKNGYYIYCSSKCACQDDDIINKRKKTCIKKYGTSSPFQCFDIIKKIKETNLKKYGVENIFQIYKRKKRNIKNNISKEEIKKNALDKRKKTNIIKYGVPHSSQKHLDIKIINKLNDKEWLSNQYFDENKSFSQIAFEIGVTKRTVINHFKQFNLKSNYRKFSSNGENQIKNFIKELNVKVDFNIRSLLNGKEIDIFIPEYNLGIEYNGLYWHGEHFTKNQWKTSYNKYNLFNKTNICNKNNIKLIHVFEHEWFYKKNIIKNYILDNIGYNENINIENCYIDSVLNPKNFIDKNSICHICDYNKYEGLFYNNKLISLFCIKENYIDFYNKISFCQKQCFNIFQKLFIKKYKPKEIYLKLNRRFYDINFVKNTQFNFYKNTKPNCFYFNLKNKCPKFSLTQDIYCYSRVYDAGDIIFAYHL